jgi:hypothetical protein
MTLWKRVLWWVSISAITVAGLLAGFPPVSHDRLVLWIVCAVVVATFLPIAIWLERDRRRQGTGSDDRPKPPVA